MVQWRKRVRENMINHVINGKRRVIRSQGWFLKGIINKEKRRKLKSTENCELLNENEIMASFVTATTSQLDNSHNAVRNYGFQNVFCSKSEISPFTNSLFILLPAVWGASFAGSCLRRPCTAHVTAAATDDDVIMEGKIKLQTVEPFNLYGFERLDQESDQQVIMKTAELSNSNQIMVCAVSNHSWSFYNQGWDSQGKTCYQQRRGAMDIERTGPLSKFNSFEHENAILTVWRSQLGENKEWWLTVQTGVPCFKNLSRCAAKWSHWNYPMNRFKRETSRLFIFPWLLSILYVSLQRSDEFRLAAEGFSVLFFALFCKIFHHETWLLFFPQPSSVFPAIPDDSSTELFLWYSGSLASAPARDGRPSLPPSLLFSLPISFQKMSHLGSTPSLLSQATVIEMNEVTSTVADEEEPMGRWWAFHSFTRSFNV